MTFSALKYSPKPVIYYLPLRGESESERIIRGRGYLSFTEKLL